MQIDSRAAADRMRAARARKNYASVLRTINILRHKYESLSEVRAALDHINEQEYLDAINYLSLSGYIHVRTILDHVTADIADVDYQVLEAKATQRGIQLMGGAITDPMIDEV